MVHLPSAHSVPHCVESGSEYEKEGDGLKVLLDFAVPSLAHYVAIKGILLDLVIS